MIRISLILLFFPLSTLFAFAQTDANGPSRWEKDKLFNDSIYPHLELNTYLPFAAQLEEIKDWSEVKRLQEKLKTERTANQSQQIPQDTSQWRLCLMKFEEQHGLMLQNQVYTSKSWFKAKDTLAVISMEGLGAEMVKEGDFQFDKRLYSTLEHQEIQANTWYFMLVGGDMIELIMWGGRTGEQDKQDTRIFVDDFYSTWTLSYVFVRP